MPLILDVDTDLNENTIEIKMAQDAGVEFARSKGRSAQAVIKGLLETNADGALTSYSQFPREVFESCPNLKVVSRTGVGYDEIDVEAATEYGVAVCNVPSYGTEVVSDHALALTLATLRRINELDANMRKGIWGYQHVVPLGQCYGRTFGVVGMGEIGRATARKASGMGFEVVCYSRSLKPGRRTPEGYPILHLEKLLQVSDVVSLHVALTPATHHLIDQKALENMKDQAILINTARGAIVDTRALAQALESGKLWGAGLDVYEEEQPFDFSHPIMSAPHTVLTPHAAFSSTESMLELRQRAMQSAIDVVLGRMPVDCLNPEVFG